MATVKKVKKGFWRILTEFSVGVIGFSIVAFYSNVMVAVGVLVLIELNNYMKGD